MDTPTKIKRPKIEISPEVLKELNAQVHEMGQVVLHILFSSQTFSEGTYIRIWPSSFLFDHDSDHASELVHCENITLAPTWQVVEAGDKCYFTLIFSGLPRDCRTFDFIEYCGGQGGGFEIRNIARSESDIYYFKMS